MAAPDLMLYAEPYHWFGEIALIDQLPRSQDAVADIASTVLVVSRPLLEAWLDLHPQYWRDLARLACGKLRLMLTALEDNASLSLEQQLARRLLFSVTNFGQATQGGRAGMCACPGLSGAHAGRVPPDHQQATACHGA